MAIVTEWQKPLEESLEAILRNPDATIKDLEEVRRALSMLCEGESVKALFAKVDEVYRQRIVSFRDAEEKVKNGKTREEVTDAMNEIRSLDVYLDKTEILRLGEERLEAFRVQEQKEAEAKEIRRKKRKRNIAITAVACVFAVVLACVFFVKHQEAKLNEMKEQLQVLINEGNTDEIAEQLQTMKGYFATTDDIDSLYETTLESVAVNRDFETAFAVYDKVSGNLSYGHRSEFQEWSDEKLNDPALSPENKWQIVRYSLDQNRLDSSDSKASDAFNACFRTIVEATEQEKADFLPDMKAWIEKNRPYLASVPADPDLALRLCYSAESLGMDLKALFPDGIAVNIPLGISVGAFNNYLRSDEYDVQDKPDLSKILPISVIEKTTDNGTEIYNSRNRSQKMLEDFIYTLQETDTHYTVMLLPEYLMSIPEEMRAGSFEECTAVIAMQQLWVLSGCTYTTTTSSNSGRYSIPLSSSNYRGYYLALDCVAIYDLSAPDHFSVVEMDFHESQMDEEGWYYLHKDNPDIYTAENMLGEHDPETLKEKYDNTLADLSLYKFLFSLSGE